MNLNRQIQRAARDRMLLAAVVLTFAFGMVNSVAAEKIASPTTPAAITPPPGSIAYLEGHAVGTQGYVCLPAAAGAASWTVNNARPEATLFESSSGKDVQIITHFLSPDANPNQSAPTPLPFGNATWQSSADSSRVWAKQLTSIAAGSDASCPNAGAIGCLLLQAIGSQPGPDAGRNLVETTFIQRLNTNGGSAPADGCSTPADIGRQALVPYSADYYFYRRAE